MAIGMKSAERLAILCFYEKEGCVDSYVYHLVEELMSVSDQTIIVVNGQMEEKAKAYFEEHHCIVWVRANEGYDAGAYRYVFRRLGESEINRYARIILCNDTFFGPFIPMKSIFGQMETKKSDFWGIAYQDTKLVQFIGSYFLVFGEKTICSGDLWNYFRELQEIADYQDALIAFEMGIFLYMKKKGYVSGAYISKKKYFSNIVCPYENLRYERLPILKKRAFMDGDKENLRKALGFIRENFLYDINLIYSWMQRNHIRIETDDGPGENARAAKANEMPVLSIEDIEQFIRKWKEVYIYGNGYYGHILMELYRIKPKYIIVSDGQAPRQSRYKGIPVKTVSEVDLQKKEAGIIVALNKSNTQTVKKTLGGGDNLLYLW